MPDPVYAIIINYDVTVDGLTLNHQQRLRVALASGESAPVVGTDLSNINLRTRGTGFAPSSVVADLGLGAYLTAMTQQYTSAMNVNSAALTYFPTGLQGSGIYIGAADFSNTTAYPNLVGHATNQSIIPAQGAVFTFFDTRGAVGKVTLMETRSSSNQYVGYASLDVDEQAYVDYLVGSTSIVASVAESLPMAFKVMSTSQNEILAYKRYPKQ